MDLAVHQLRPEEGCQRESVGILAKQLRALELAAVFVLIIVQIWLCKGKVSVPAYLALAIVAAGFLIRKVGLREIGLINLTCMAPLFAAFFLKFLFGHSFEGQQHVSDQAIVTFIGYFPWALFQEIILNAFFAQGLRSQMSDARIPWLVGCISGIVHIPNPVLMPIAFLGGAGASWFFLRAKRKNIYILAAAHALVAVAVFYGLPASWHHHLVIGPKFWRFR